MIHLWRAVLLTALALLSFPPPRAAWAQQNDLAGVWQGQLAPDPNSRINIQFTFSRKPDGSYAAVLNSPDNPAVKNLAASGVSFQGGNLALQVPALQGSYAATLRDGKLDGQWTQPGGKLRLVLTPYQAPALSKAAMDVLQGAWNGKLTGPGGNEVTLVTRFKSGDKGELIATLAQIEGGGQEMPLSDVAFTDNKLTFRLPRANATYEGTYANGAITGRLKVPGPAQPPEGSPITFKRGDVAVPTHPLKLSTGQFATLNGSWKGKLETPNRALTLVMRFETNRDGQYVAFLDSPDQGAKGIPVTDLTFDGSKIRAQVAAVNGVFEGILSGGTMTGTWTQGPQSLSLVLTRT